MRRLLGSAFWVVAALFLTFSLAGAQAAERSTTIKPDTDLPGFDYQVIKGTKLPACQTACEGDNLCRAFTFNQKAGWCFLKGGVGQETAFKGATSGVIAMSPSAETIAAERTAEIPFPAYDLIQSAQSFAADLARTDPAPEGLEYADLVASGDQAVEQSNPAGAWVSYRQALGIMRNDPALWLKLSDVSLARAKAEQQAGNSSYEFASTASYSALSALLLSETVEQRSGAFAALARALAVREMWRESIASYRASIGLVDDETLQAELDAAVAEHGFRVTSNVVDAEAATPRICAVFSETLPDASTDLSGYVVVANAPTAAIETQESQICVEGLQHGQRYNVKLRAGLPAASGETLQNDVELDLYVPDRAPFVGFANNAYVMPAGLGGGLPITSINAEIADVVIYRIGDRSIAAAVRNGVFRGTLDEYKAEDIASQTGEEAWRGQVDLAQGKPNELSTTAIPVAEVLTDTQPGAYVITARVNGEQQEYWQELATQWFIVTDLGLTTVSGDDGVHAFVRSLDSAGPVAGAKVKLVAVNNEILGEAVSDAEGRVTFAPGLARGAGGRAPQLLVAETEGGDYAFLDLTKPAFDLTDRGVEGRPSPGPLDLFATSERGIYRPGETVFLTATLRDPQARAVRDLPLTLEIERPDGVVAQRQVLSDQGAGGYFAAIDMVEGAMRGAWQARFYADPNAAPLSNVTFLLEDFEPERLAFEISAGNGLFVPDTASEIAIAAKYLYGATAPGLSIEADVVLRPKSTIAGWPGYTFGRLDDTFQTDRQPLGIVGVTDEAGDGVATITVPSLQSTTRPLEAQVLLRLVDTNGRTVERSLTRGVDSRPYHIGIRPRFDENVGLAEGSEASFDISAVDSSGGIAAVGGLNWTLSRLDTSYQWYRDGSTWKWEAITTTREVANGPLNLLSNGPGTISAPVDWGRYLLEIESSGENATSSSYEFYAGYYYAEAGSDTPDTLQVALDKPAYKVGDTAVLKLDPQFAGTALVMVVDNRIIDMRAVPVPAEGTSVDLTVTEEWGPGAYVTAVLYRPSSAAEKRMPARALGLAFADVEPGNRLLNVAVDAPGEALPRQAFTTTIKLDGVAAGQRAYVAVAAVDLGILNLTNFKTPDPDGWYFGQRQLGMEFRDLYGQLIDPTQGLAGAIRSGGDGEASRPGTPPPTSVLVALHSGIVEVGPDGTATVSFEMPDFSGTVRLMAMAWTDTAVGHADRDVIVRDPVVVTMSPPRFLRLDDNSRLLVEINNVSGPAGDYRVALETGNGLSTDAAETIVNLAAGGRTSLDLGLRGDEIGDQQLTLTVTGPTGIVQTKELTLGVRATSAPITTSTLLTLDPGKTVTIGASYFDAMAPHTGSLTLAIGPIARLDVPGLLMQLDRYPYGCAEQISSRALPLLYLNEVAEMIGLGSDDALNERVKAAITNILSKQTSAGSFGLWGPSSYTDFWLDAYVTDFLLRAQAEGYEIPELAMTMALDNLANQLSYASDFSNGGEDIAYALYDLAKAGRAAIGDLRYYFEARLDAFGSPLAKAQLGAALALYGDRTRATEAFDAAVAALDAPEDRSRYRSDYGSPLRDMAGVVALVAEFTPSGIDLGALTTRLADMRDRAVYTSTQEDAWTLVAAAALAKDAGDGSVSVKGESITGAVYQRYDQEYFDGSEISLANNANQPTEAKVSVTGIPLTPPPASSSGFTIYRNFYTPTGGDFDPAQDPITQNDRFVVVLTVTADALGSGQYVVSDPLPAGFEIENPDLSASAGVGDLAWLRTDMPAHVESRTDQFVAAYRYSSAVPTFTAAYFVRAVSPGTFVLPGATVEDMYRPDLRANTDAGTIEIAPAGLAPKVKPVDDLTEDVEPVGKANDKGANR